MPERLHKWQPECPPPFHHTAPHTAAPNLVEEHSVRLLVTGLCNTQALFSYHYRRLREAFNLLAAMRDEKKRMHT